MKKIFGLIIILAVALICVSAAADVKLDAEHFPDEAFRNQLYIFDLDGNSVLEDSEIEQAEFLDCPDCGITSIEGIQYLTSLFEVHLNDNQITTADFSKNKQLQHVRIYSNLLSSLNVSGNRNLLSLACSNNRLSSITLPDSPDFGYLDISTNGITTLDVTKTPLLAELIKAVPPTDYIYWEAGYSINWILDTPEEYLFLAVDRNVTVKSGGSVIAEPDLPTEYRKDGVKYALDYKKKTAYVSGVTDPDAASLTVDENFDVFSDTFKVTAIGDNAFKGLKNLKTVTIGKTVKTIGRNAFSNCKKLKTVKGGANVETIKAGAFSGCVKLSKLPAFKKLTTIGATAFKGCKALTKITIGANVKSIGKNAFNGCAKLKTVTIQAAKLKTVGAGAFKGIYAKATFKCPKKQKAAYEKLLRKKGAPKTAKFK